MADHLRAKAAAYTAAGPAIAPIAPIAIAPIAAPIIAGPRPYVGPLAGVPQLVPHPNGAVVPADEPAVVAARADHLRAKGIPFHAAVASGPGLVGPAVAPIAA